MLWRIWILIQKEVLAVLRDKKARTVLFIPPIMQLMIFAFAATLDVKNVSMAVLNRDNGEQSVELVQRFIGSPTFKSITFLKGVEDIAPYIDNQKGMMVLSIDEQFSRNLDAKKPADVQLILDGRRSNSAQIVAGYSSVIIDQFNQDFSKEYRYNQQKTTTISRFWFNPNLIYQWFNVPSLCGVLTMLVGLTITSLSVARERELGTFDQLLVSPIMPMEILLGKMIPALVIGLFEGTIIVVAAIFFFHIPFTGSFFTLYLGMFTFIWAIVGIGLFISSLCQTQQQAILGTFIFMTPAVMLSGYVTPIENMPTWLQPITYINPLRYFLVIAKASFTKAMPFHLAFQNIWPLVVIGIFTTITAAKFFRSRLQ